MPKTRMVARDFQMFAGELSTFYTPLFGTPAADVARRMNQKLFDALHYTADEEPDDDMAVAEELEEGGYQITLSNNAFIPEEALRQNGLDATVNEAIDELEQGIRDGLYPANSYQRVMVDHMLAGLRSIQKRDLIYDVQNNPNADEVPAATVDRKTANYTFVPKMVEKGIDEDGNEIDIYPEGFAENDGLRGFVPRDDARDYGKHTVQELQTAADKINYKGLGESAESYTTGVREVLDLATMKKPRDAAQEEVLRQHILTNNDYVRQQINRARHADPADLKMRAIFMDDLSKVDDSLFSDTRGLGGDLEKLDQYERYIRSGLPIAGFREYKAMYDTAFNLTGPTNTLAENTVGLEGLVTAVRDMDARLKQLPPENATEEQRNAWRDGVREAMQRYRSELGKVDRENIPFREGIEDVKKNTVRNNFERNASFDRESRNIGGHLENLDHLGEKSIQDRRNYVRGMMKDMADGMDDISRELKQRSKDIRTDDKNFKDAIDKAIYAGDSDNAVSPQRFSQALSRLQTEAAANNRPELVDWLAKQRAWFDNRM
ncbi:MAG: hypothetical protein IK096_07105, partial [Lachnospiraceae bacterium]|nr:hypothetical protein [Lachnospiraceae bacterium]